jgi:hypothetical protein
MEPGSTEATRKHELESPEESDVSSAKRARPAEPEVNGNSQHYASTVPAKGDSGAAAPAEERAPAPSAGAETAVLSAAADAPAWTSSEAPAALQEGDGTYAAWYQPEESSSTGAAAAEDPPAPVMAPPPGFGAGGYSGAGYGGPGYGGPGVGGGVGGFGGGAQVCRDFQNGLCHRGARCVARRRPMRPAHSHGRSLPATPHLSVPAMRRLSLECPRKPLTLPACLLCSAVAGSRTSVIPATPLKCRSARTSRMECAIAGPRVNLAMT